MKTLRWLVGVLILACAALAVSLAAVIQHEQESLRMAALWKDEATVSEQAVEQLRGAYSRAIEGKRTCEAAMRGGEPSELERWKGIAVGQNAMHRRTTTELNRCNATKATKP